VSLRSEQQPLQVERKPPQARAVVTREALLDAAAAVFDERGYHGTSIADIVERGATTKGALYFHFPSKEALAKAVMEVHADGIPIFDAALGVQGVIDATMLIGTRLRTDVRLRAGVRLAIEQASFIDPDTAAFNVWIDRSREGFNGAKAVGDLLAHVDPQTCAELMVGAFAGVQLLSQATCDRADLPRRLADLWATVLPGIVTPEALAHIIITRESG